MNSPEKVIAVNSIRPDSLIALQKDAQKADSAWLDTKRQFFETAYCPLHGQSASSTKLYDLKNGLFYNICEECETLFLGSRPNPATYEEFYNTSATMKLFATHIFPQSYDIRIEKIYRPRLSRMLDYYTRHHGKAGDFLEVGAGSGVFAGLVKDSKQFASCTVIEPSPSLAASCREKGLHVIQKPIEQLTDAKPFSNVTLVACFELLEHLIDPDKFVKKIYSLLPVGGLFCLSTPNGRGVDILELKEISTTLGLTHINLFNPKSIQILLEGAGFTILELATPGVLDVDLVCRGYAERRQTNSTPDDDSWLQYFLSNGTDDMKRALQDFWVSQKQSSHMWAICQK